MALQRSLKVRETRNIEEDYDLTSEESDVEVVQETFDVEGISAEELRYWSELAPQDQKLTKMEPSAVESRMMSSKSLDQAEV